LFGENKHAVLVDGSGEQRVITVRGTNDVEVTGLTIKNGGTPEVFGYGVEIYACTNISIHDCIITENQEGIHLNINTKTTQSADDIMIYDNVISHNTIGVYGENPCTLTGNHIANNTVGVEIADASKNISSNEFRDNDIGIQTYNVRDTRIAENNFIHNRIHTKILKVIPVICSPLLVTLRISWDGNYWDNWKTSSPRPVIGLNVLYVYLIIIQQPVLFFPGVQFDPHPVSEPYVI
jgi:parallel beta-helix repeat protein